MEKFKIKPLTKEQLIISIDRLTRFKNTEVKYLRVFKDIISNNLIQPKLKKQELESFEYNTLKDLAEKIINLSIENLGIKSDGDISINQKLLEYEDGLFKLSDPTRELLKNKINYKGFLSLIPSTKVKNLNWLYELNSSCDIKKIREEKSILFPIEKVIICEGITEETLLPAFADLYGFNFNKNGIYILSAGGKNQVVKTYYELSQTLKVPIFVLLDKDAEENLKSINVRLRDIDSAYILQCGEFEDLLPQELLERAISYAFNNISILDTKLLSQDLPKVKILEEIFKTRGLHEFKKAEFANIVKLNIKSKEDLSPEIKEILDELKNLNQTYTK